MVNIASVYATNVGQLILNLTERGYMVKMQTEKNLFDKSVLYIQIFDMKRGKSVKHAISEDEISNVLDISLIADAVIERIKKL